MSLSVSSRMARVKPSPTGAILALATELRAQGRDIISLGTGAILALATELRAQGRDIISLGTGEPDFDTPQFIKDAAVQAIADGATKYTPVDGTAELKAAIQRKFARENSLNYSSGQILVTSGAKQALFNLCLALLSAEDEVIIPAPYWVSYPDMVRLADAEPVIIETGLEADFKITPTQLAAAITSKTRLLILNSPGNPTGASYTRSELQALGEVLAKHPKIAIVSDEIYEHILWADEAFLSFAQACPDLYDRTITINGVSKAYAMTGWRIGYAAGPHELIKAMKTIQSQSTSNACSVSQVAATAALDGNQTVVANMTAEYKKRHDYIVAALNEFDGFECRPGEGTFYAFPKISGLLRAKGLESDTDLVELLLSEADVACVPGSAFGAPGYMRLSFACSIEMLREAMKRIKRALYA